MYCENAAIKREWSWNAPFQPFRLIGNIHYVGASGISSILFTTPEGHILRELGFRLTDIKIILNSHAHTDHAGGHALMHEFTGARILMSEADAALLPAAVPMTSRPSEFRNTAQLARKRKLASVRKFISLAWLLGLSPFQRLPL